MLRNLCKLQMNIFLKSGANHANTVNKSMIPIRNCRFESNDIGEPVKYANIDGIYMII